MTTAEERTRGMGLLGAAFGLGFIVGPATGGILASYDSSYPSWVAAALCVINLYCIIKFLPESRKSANSSGDSNQFVPGLSTAKEIVTSRKLSTALALRLGYMIVFTTFELWFGYVTSDRLGLIARESSYLLTLFGCVYVWVQAAGMRKLVEKFQETQLLAIVLSLLVASYAAAYFMCTTTLMFTIVLVPLGLLSGVSNTLISSLVSKQVSREHLGGALGVSASIGSLSRIIGPTITSYLVQSVDITAPPVFCAIVALSCVLLQSILKRQLASEAQSQNNNSEKTIKTE